MNGHVARKALLAALVAVTAATAAFAQTAPAPSAAPAPPAAPRAQAPAASADPAAPATGAAPAPSAAPADTAAEPPIASKGNITGYAFGGKRSPPPPVATSASHHARLPHHANEAVATLSGFEMLADGGSRLFVQLSRQVELEQQRGPGQAASSAPRKGKRARGTTVSPGSGPTLTFVLKGAEVLRRNDENALVTVHFNTPVVRARLLPAGRDLRFVVDLRADATPSVKIVPAKDNGAMLQIDFPQGAYLPAGGPAAAPPTDDSSAEGGTPDSMESK